MRLLKPFLTCAVLYALSGLFPVCAQNGSTVAGITGSDPRPPRSGVVVAGITGSDPRPPRSGVVIPIAG